MQSSKLASVAAWVILVGGILSLCFFGFQIFKIRLETGDSFPEYSTYRADPKGLKAFYESLEDTNLIHVGRRLRSSKILPSGEDQVLVVAGVLADQQIVSDEDSRFFDHWLATGGRLIVALHPEKLRSSRSQSVAQANPDTRDDPSSILWRNLILRWGAEIVPLTQIHPATANSPLFGIIARWLGRHAFDRLSSDWKVVALQGDENVIVERKFGRGSLVLLTDSYSLSNEALATDRNTDFLLWLIDHRRGVLFEETHLGLNEQPGIMALAQRYGLRGTLISVIAVLLLFVWKCTYTLVPPPKVNQDSLAVAGCSSDQAFLNLLQRAVPQDDLLSVCLTAWLKTARPTLAQLADPEKFRPETAKERPLVEGYNELITLMNERI